MKTPHSYDEDGSWPEAEPYPPWPSSTSNFTGRDPVYFYSWKKSKSYRGSLIELKPVLTLIIPRPVFLPWQIYTFHTVRTPWMIYGVIVAISLCHTTARPLKQMAVVSPTHKSLNKTNTSFEGENHWKELDHVGQYRDYQCSTPSLRNVHGKYFLCLVVLLPGTLDKRVYF